MHLAHRFAQLIFVPALTRFALLSALLSLGACRVNPPRTGLCYSVSGPANGWAQTAEGRLVTSVHGVTVEVDLSGGSSRIGAKVQNGGTEAVEIRMGGEAVSPSKQIGEMLQRPLRPEPGAVGADYKPYSSMQRVRVEAGWRATFYLDSPLGREPTYGQFFVFTVEVQPAAGPVERRSIPLIASHVVTDSAVPARRRGTDSGR